MVRTSERGASSGVTKARAPPRNNKVPVDNETVDLINVPRIASK